MDSTLSFPVDEPKQAVKWQKGYDFMDGSPRYTFEHRDPTTTYARFQVVIYVERMREHPHDPRSVRNYYYGYVCDDRLESSDTVGPFRTLKEAKTKTLELFNLFITDGLGATG